MESQKGLGAIIGVREAFYDNAEEILSSAYGSARLSLLMAWYEYQKYRRLGQLKER